MSGGQLLGAALGTMLMKKSAKAPSAPSTNIAAPAPAVKPVDTTPELELNDSETMAEAQRKKRRGKRQYRVDKIRSSEAAGVQGTSGSSMDNLKIK